MRFSMVGILVALSIGGPSGLGAQAASRTTAPPTKSPDPIPADAPVFSRQGMWFQRRLGRGVGEPPLSDLRR